MPEVSAYNILFGKSEERRRFGRPRHRREGIIR
jgi:hypothetical protein